VDGLDGSVGETRSEKAMMGFLGLFNHFSMVSLDSELFSTNVGWNYELSFSGFWYFRGIS
jgi:hypothetical protein